MPHFEPTAPRISLKVAGLALTAPAPFAEGHTLTAPEAAYLNRQVATSVANPIPAALKAENEATVAKGLVWVQPSAEELQTQYDARYATFTLGQSNRTSGETSTSDPVTRFAREIAKTELNKLLKAKGKNIREVMQAKREDGSSAYTYLVSQFLAANPQITDMAKAQVEAMDAASYSLDFGDTAA